MQNWSSLSSPHSTPHSLRSSLHPGPRVPALSELPLKMWRAQGVVSSNWTTYAQISSSSNPVWGQHIFPYPNSHLWLAKAVQGGSGAQSRWHCCCGTPSGCSVPQRIRSWKGETCTEDGRCEERQRTEQWGLGQLRGIPGHTMDNTIPGTYFPPSGGRDTVYTSCLWRTAVKQSGE